MGRETKFDKLMKLLVITVVKKRFLRSKKEYTIYVLYTPLRKRIYKVTTTYNKFPYEKGDDISKVEKWCNDKNYSYRKRRGKSLL